LCLQAVALQIGSTLIFNLPPDTISVCFTCAYRQVHELFSGKNGYMLFTVEFIIAFLVAFGLNLIPFFGPSNLLTWSTAAIGMENTDATALLTIAFLIALATALAKGIHYMITFLLPVN
jgi:hypothetical protein